MMGFPKYSRLSQASYYYYRDLLISRLHNPRVKNRHSATIGFETTVTFTEPLKQDNYPDITLTCMGNDILLIKPDSMVFIGTDWYHTRTTRAKLDNYAPKRVYVDPSIYNEVRKDYDFIGLDYLVDIPTFILDVDVIGNSKKVSIFKTSGFGGLTYQRNATPLFEGLTVKTKRYDEEVGIPEYDTLLNYLKYKAMLVDNKLFFHESEQKVYTDLFIESVLKDRRYELLVNTQSYLPKNARRAFIIDVDTSRYQRKLTEQYTPAISKWLDDFNIYTNNPYYLRFQINGKSNGESITKMKLLDHIIQSRQPC